MLLAASISSFLLFCSAAEQASSPDAGGARVQGEAEGKEGVRKGERNGKACEEDVDEVEEVEEKEKEKEAE